MIIDLFVYTHTFVGCGFEYRCGWHALMREKWARFQSLYILSLLKGSDIKRASRRTVLLKGGYTGAIQLPLRQLEGVGIGRVVELPLPPKGMLNSMLYVAFKV